MEREHQERLAEIKYQAFKGGEEFGTSFAAGFDASYPEVKSRLKALANTIDSRGWIVKNTDVMKLIPVFVKNVE